MNRNIRFDPHSSGAQTPHAFAQKSRQMCGVWFWGSAQVELARPVRVSFNRHRVCAHHLFDRTVRGHYSGQTDARARREQHRTRRRGFCSRHGASSASHAKCVYVSAHINATIMMAIIVWKHARSPPGLCRDPLHHHRPAGVRSIRRSCEWKSQSYTHTHIFAEQTRTFNVKERARSNSSRESCVRLCFLYGGCYSLVAKSTLCVAHTLVVIVVSISARAA